MKLGAYEVVGPLGQGGAVAARAQRDDHLLRTGPHDGRTARGGVPPRHGGRPGARGALPGPSGGPAAPPLGARAAARLFEAAAKRATRWPDTRGGLALARLGLGDLASARDALATRPEKEIGWAYLPWLDPAEVAKKLETR